MRNLRRLVLGGLCDVVGMLLIVRALSKSTFSIFVLRCKLFKKVGKNAPDNCEYIRIALKQLLPQMSTILHKSRELQSKSNIKNMFTCQLLRI